MTTRTFTVDELEDLGITEGIGLGTPVIHNEVVSTHRWYEVHRAVFNHDDQLWAVDYREPLTEMQEGIDPFFADTVTATLVEPYEVSVTKYRPVSK